VLALSATVPSSPSPAPAGEQPSGALKALVAAIGAGDLEAASACFRRDASLVTPDATSVCGRSSIRSLLGQMIAAGTRVELAISSTVLAGDVALVRGVWRTVFGEGLDSRAFAQLTGATAVLRSTEGEGWKLQVLTPWEGASERRRR
jgi:ketosteroid isomerase-like protein